MSMVMTDMMDTAPVETWTFGGVTTLNGTQIPDAYFDEVMAPLGPSAFTVLMYVARRTFGFKRHSDQISLDQICHGIVTGEVRDADGTVIKPARRLDHGTGLAKSTVVRALDRLIEAGLIHKRKNTDPRRGQLANTYAIVFKDPAAVTPAPLPLSPQRTTPVLQEDNSPVSQAHSPCCVITQAPVADVDTQQTVETTNSRRHTDISKRSGRTPHSRPHLDSNDSMMVTRETSPLEPTPTVRSVDPNLSSIAVHIAHLSVEFGDDAPHASRTRVLNMQHAAGLGDEALTILLNEAATITRSQASAITKRGRGGTVIRMPYLLATLQGLMEAPDDFTAMAVPTASASIVPLTPGPGALAASEVDDPPATTEAEALWRAVLGEVRRDVTAENYAAWFASTRALALDGDVLRVGVPTPFHAQWLEHKLWGCVVRALGRTGHTGMRIAYEIATSGESSVTGDHAARVDQVAPIPLPSAVAPPPPVVPHRIPVAASTPRPRPTTVAVVASPPVVACPCCRVAPCRCRLADQLRRVVAVRAALASVRSP